MKNNKKGISLIALIIIGIIFILAVVAIFALTGNKATVGEKEEKEPEVTMINFSLNNIPYSVAYGTDWYTWTNQNYHAKYTSMNSMRLEVKNNDGTVSLFKIDNFTTGEQGVHGDWLIQEGCVYALTTLTD